MLAKLQSVFKEWLLLKVDFWGSRRFLVNIFVKYRDCKAQQRQIAKCDRFKIAKYDRAGLQIMIGFGLQSATKKIIKIESQSAMGLQSVTSLDYKLRWDYKAREITKWYNKLLQLVPINVFSDNWKALFFIKDYCYPGCSSTVMFLRSLKQVIQKTSEFLFFASVIRVQCQYQANNFLNKVSK